MCEAATMPGIWPRVFSSVVSLVIEILAIPTFFCSVAGKRTLVGKVNLTGENVIEIVVNGEARQVPLAMLVSELLEHLEFNTRAIAVEINQQIQPRDTHQKVQVKAGDVVEIVSLVGGG